MAVQGDVLHDRLVIQLSSQVSNTTPARFSVILNFSHVEGENAERMAFVKLDIQSAYERLLHRYIGMHGRGTESALKLRMILWENGLAPCAQIIEAELKRQKIPFPDHADAAVIPNLPSPPGGAPDAAINPNT